MVEVLGVAADANVEGWDANAENPPPPAAPNVPVTGLRREDCPNVGCEVCPKDDAAWEGCEKAEVGCAGCPKADVVCGG